MTLIIAVTIISICCILIGYIIGSETLKAKDAQSPFKTDPPKEYWPGTDIPKDIEWVIESDALDFEARFDHMLRHLAINNIAERKVIESGTRKITTEVAKESYKEALQKVLENYEDYAK